MALAYQATDEGDVCRRLATSFAGVPAGQTWVDYYVWEIILNDRPNVNGIVEIGTWKGGFSRYLAAQARARGISFVTFDAVVPENPPPGFERLDVFASPERIVEELEALGTFVLLCDGGNKARELRLFAPDLNEGSLIIVHDWLTEIFPEDVPSSVVEVYGGLCDKVGSMSRCFAVSS